MGRNIYDIRDLTTASEEILKGIDKAVLATAFKVRDDARASFKGSSNLYKHSASHSYDKLAEGIMVGKLRGGQVKVHAMGSKENYNSYKTRFFVGGTTYRQSTSKNGVAFTKGFIQPNNAIENGVNMNQSTLSNYINNVLNNNE